MSPTASDRRKSWITLLNLNCAEASRLIAERLDRPLRRPERIGLSIHLFLCKWCRRYRLQLQLIRQWVAALASADAADDDTRLPEQARRRLAQQIERA